MSPLALALSFFCAAAEPETAVEEIAVAPVEEVAAAPVDEWPGEHRRVHFGLGYRAHAGMMYSERTPFLVLQSELLGFLTIRLGRHNELRVQVGFAGGYPDTVAGESNVGFRWALNQRFTVGISAVALWGFWSLRGGFEVPLSLRLGSSRRHELTLALRCTTGVYNNNTFVWYDFAKQRFALAGDVALGYSFIF